MEKADSKAKDHIGNEIEYIERQTVGVSGSPAEDLTRERKQLKSMFLLFGITSLLGFNSIISPADYYSRFYPSVMMSCCSLVYNLANMIITITMMTVGYRWNIKRNVNISLYTWFISIILIPCIQPILPDVKSDSQMNGKLVLTLVFVAFCGACSGLFLPTIMSVAQNIQKSMTARDGVVSQALMVAIFAGQGLAGIIPQGICVLCKGLTQAVSQGKQSDDEIYYSTLTYFIIADLFIIVSIILWIRVSKKYPNDVINKLEKVKKSKRPSDSVNLLSESNTPAREEDSIAISDGENITGDNSAVQNLQMENNISTPVTEKPANFRQVFCMIAEPGISVLFVFLVTLAVFPGITAKIPNIHRLKTKQELDNSGWHALLNQSLFMIFDYVGRVMPESRVLMKIPIRGLTVFSFARVIFVPLFVLMVLPFPVESADGKYDSDLPYIHSDILTWFVMIVFATTNGYVGSTIMSKYTILVKREIDISLASSIQSGMLNVGLLLGGLISLIIDLCIDK